MYRIRQKNEPTRMILGATILFAVVVWIGGALLTGCQSAQTPQAPVETAPVPLPDQGERIALYWENTTEPHPERALWSDALTKLISANLSQYDSAKDITTFCPQFKSLNDRQKVKAIGELWVATTYYESGFNIKSQSVDVGTADNKNTWSVGLLQMSVVDQESYGFDFGYSFADLNTAIPNITLAHAVMISLLKKHGEIALKTGLYWAVLRDGDKFIRREAYCDSNPSTCAKSSWKTGWCAMQGSTCKLTRLPDIIDRVKKYAGGCT